MQQAGVQLLEMPHERASKLLDQLTGMSDCAIHEVLALDVLQVCPDAAEIQDIAQAAAGRKWRPIVVLAIDAADVPSRPETAQGPRPGRKKSRARRARIARPRASVSTWSTTSASCT